MKKLVCFYLLIIILAPCLCFAQMTRILFEFSDENNQSIGGVNVIYNNKIIGTSQSGTGITEKLPLSIGQQKFSFQAKGYESKDSILILKEFLKPETFRIQLKRFTPLLKGNVKDRNGSRMDQTPILLQDAKNNRFIDLIYTDQKGNYTTRLPDTLQKVKISVLADTLLNDVSLLKNGWNVHNFALNSLSNKMRFSIGINRSFSMVPYSSLAEQKGQDGNPEYVLSLKEGKTVIYNASNMILDVGLSPKELYYDSNTMLVGKSNYFYFPRSNNFRFSENENRTFIFLNHSTNNPLDNISFDFITYFPQNLFINCKFMYRAFEFMQIEVKKSRDIIDFQTGKEAYSDISYTSNPTVLTKNQVISPILQIGYTNRLYSDKEKNWKLAYDIAAGIGRNVPWNINAHLGYRIQKIQLVAGMNAYRYSYNAVLSDHLAQVVGNMERNFWSNLKKNYYLLNVGAKYFFW